MLRLKTEDEKALREFVKELPTFLYTSQEQVEISGEDLLLGGYSKKDGIEKGKTYYISCPVYIEANHYRRIKRAYQRNGMEAVDAYIKSVVFAAGDYLN